VLEPGGDAQALLADLERALRDGRAIAASLAASVWSVAIRTLVVQGGAGRLGVGGGSASDADPAAEHAEPLAKGRFLSHPVPAPTLFETMRWEAGVLRRWSRHRDRLARSAAALGLPFDAGAAEAAVATALAATGAPGGPGPLRVRLELAEDGACRAQARPHADDGHEPLRVAWSDVAVRSDDPARRHKTLDRALYDAAHAWARAGGWADVLFLNQDGRVAEGAISNVFVRGPDGRWRTPPVADGALPGVLRAELLESGEAVESPLRPEDLRAGPLAIGSALRGLRLVRLEEAPRWPAAAARPGP